MTALEVFDYSGWQVRTMLIDGEPWFVLADLCTVLGLTSPSRTAERLDQDGVSRAQVIDALGREQNATIVNEAGMYEVVIRSDKPEAIAFRRWVTGTVLPAIRKTGSYSVQPELTREQRLAQAVLESAEVIKELDAKVLALTAPAAAWTHMVAAEGDYAVADAAKTLSRDPEVSIGRDRLFAFMSDQGWIYRSGPRRSWKAYQEQVDNGRLVEKLSRPFLNERTGEYELPAPTIRVTTKGLAELRKRLVPGLRLVSTA